ncbi:MAG: FtsH protease activity modulator HflK [Alphaproteobacteria bacterium]
MPWNNNDKDNNSNNQSPWGSNKPTNKELEEFIKNSREKFKNLFNKEKSPDNNGKIFALIALGLLGAWLITGLYKVEEGEQAVVLRFGKFSRVSQAGLNYHLPEPFETSLKAKVDRVESEEIGFTNSSEKNYNQRSNLLKVQPEKSLMLTGDENIIDVNFVVQWKISNIEDYIFNVANPQETVRSAAESAMREVIGSNPIAAPLTEGKSNIELTTKGLLQSILDSYNSGIAITNLRMARVDPPSEVIDAFRDVQTARADKEREINQAQAYHNDIIPRARGEASRIVQDAEAYKQEVVAIATGEVSRFNAIYDQYKISKQVTKQRLYLETMESVLKDMEKIIIDKNLDKNTVSYLPLPQLSNKINGQ